VQSGKLCYRMVQTGTAKSRDRPSNQKMPAEKRANSISQTASGKSPPAAGSLKQKGKDQNPGAGRVIEFQRAEGRKMIKNCLTRRITWRPSGCGGFQEIKSSGALYSTRAPCKVWAPFDNRLYSQESGLLNPEVCLTLKIQAGPSSSLTEPNR